MNIGVIGFESATSLPQRLCEEFAKMKLGRVISFSIMNMQQRIPPEQRPDFLYWKNPISLKNAVRVHFPEPTSRDLIFIEQSYLYFKVDYPVNVAYFHAELNCPITVLLPKWYANSELHSCLYMKLYEANDLLHAWHPQMLQRYKHRKTFYPAAHPPFFRHDITNAPLWDSNVPNQPGVSFYDKHLKKHVDFSWIGPRFREYCKSRDIFQDSVFIRQLLMKFLEAKGF